MAVNDLADERAAAAARSVTAVTVVSVFGILYAAQGFTASLAQFVLPSILRDKGVPLAQIGLTYLLFSPLVLKPFWAPAMDRWSMGLATRRLAVIHLCQVSLVLIFLCAALLNPENLSQAFNPAWMAAALLIVMVVIASQDISTDALAIEAVPTNRRGVAGSTQVAGTYLGYVLGSSAWLPLYVAFGWSVAMGVLAFILAVLTAVVKVTSGSLSAPAFRVENHPAPSLLGALRRPQLVTGIGFLVLYQLGGRLAASLLGPFMIDAGLSLATVSWVVGIGTVIAGICGAVIGPIFIRGLGVSRFLCLFALLHAACVVGLWGVAIGKPSCAVEAIIVLVILESALFALAYVGLFVKMMGWCAAHQAGTDFSLLQSVDSALAIGAGLGASLVAGVIGYSLVFLLSAFLLVAAAIVAFAAGRPAAATPHHIS
ncbi:MFS transporter [Ensifer sp. YR511]|uniref:MFS transporter n=1 Tax=Ensifer sp. YR511 TaxID=1855294 RepID=UPI000882C787|nr:MFS transporter [Ensifer sp. YR511]SDN02679.1 MFS transporter, putative signal transducer [Ensifer sp. YR511]